MEGFTPPLFLTQCNRGDMVAKKIMGTLSTEGWIAEIAARCDRLLSYFFVSDYSQSELYSGNISSLPYIIKTYGDDELRLKTTLTNTLNDYLGRYFDRADVVTSTNVVSDTDNRIEIKLIITVYEDNVQHSVGHLIQTVNSTISSIVNINNTSN